MNSGVRRRGKIHISTEEKSAVACQDFCRGGAGNECVWLTRPCCLAHCSTTANGLTWQYPSWCTMFFVAHIMFLTYVSTSEVLPGTPVLRETYLLEIVNIFLSILRHLDRHLIRLSVDDPSDAPIFQRRATRSLSRSLCANAQYFSSHFIRLKIEKAWASAVSLLDCFRARFFQVSSAHFLEAHERWILIMLSRHATPLCSRPPPGTPKRRKTFAVSHIRRQFELIGPYLSSLYIRAWRVREMHSRVELNARKCRTSLPRKYFPQKLKKETTRSRFSMCKAFTAIQIDRYSARR